MTRGACAGAIAALALSACNQAPNERASSTEIRSNEASPATAAPATALAVRTPLREPQGATDPKSAGAAGRVVQHYGALIEQKRWAEANALWNDPASGAWFANKLQSDRAVHLSIGNPRKAEGAAGSIYVTIPTVLYGEDSSGAPFRCPADVTLRRVNDVPGSTEEQRRWHIWTIEC